MHPTYVTWHCSTHCHNSGETLDAEKLFTPDGTYLGSIRTPTVSLGTGESRSLAYASRSLACHVSEGLHRHGRVTAARLALSIWCRTTNRGTNA
jgi:hypothetical protein